MKHLILCLPLIFCLFSCNKSESPSKSFESHGEILGLDEALCGCCGNWIIVLDDELRVQFKSLPASSRIDLENESFPLEVNLDWEHDTSNFCQHIVILDIEKK